MKYLIEFMGRLAASLFALMIALFIVDLFTDNRYINLAYWLALGAYWVVFIHRSYTKRYFPFHNRK